MTSIRRADSWAPGGAAFALVFSCTVAARAASVWEPMAAMSGMTLPGGTTHSMQWTPMHGASWSGTARAFVTMWSSMMIPMMLPSAVPALWRVRDAFERRDGVGKVYGRALAPASVVLAAVAYFAVWIALGAALFPVGALAVALLRQAPTLAHTVPALTVAIVVAGGTIQFTTWKGRRLDACRRVHGNHAHAPSASNALRFGLRLGGHCVASCANWTAILLVCGMTDPAAMLAVTGAITAERLVPHTQCIRRLTGGVAIAVAIVLLVVPIVGG